MNTPVATSYQLGLVVLSLLIAILGSFVALTAASRIKRSSGKLSIDNAIAAGFALGGIGVWAMHFVGMLSLKMDVATSYSLVETIVSLVAAIAASACALAFVAAAPHRLSRVFGAGATLGLGVVFMHYLGMYGMRFGGFVLWNFAVVGISVVIAVVAATAALWLAFNTSTVALRMGAAILMGVAVCTMHYTGMAAAEFVCTTTNRFAMPQGWGLVSSIQLPTLVVAVSLVLAILILIDQAFQGAVVRSASVKRARPVQQSRMAKP